MKPKELFHFEKTKYEIKAQTVFKRQLKLATKQGKNLEELKKVVFALASGEKLDDKYQNHKLVNDKYYKGCFECHIEPNWLLVYTYMNENLILVLVNLGSH